MNAGGGRPGRTTPRWTARAGRRCGCEGQRRREHRRPQRSAASADGSRTGVCSGLVAVAQTIFGGEGHVASGYHSLRGTGTGCGTRGRGMPRPAGRAARAAFRAGLFRGGGSLLASARCGDGHGDDDLVRAIRLVSLIPRALHSAAECPRSRTPLSCRGGWR